MAQNSSATPDTLDIDALMSSEGEENAVAPSNYGLEPPSSLKSPESMGLGGEGVPTGTLQNPPAAQNGGQGVPVDVIDLTRPTKTEGEPSNGGSTAIHAPSSFPATGTPVLANNSTSLHSAVSAAGLPSVAGTPDGLSSSMSASTFGGTPLASLGSQLKLTAEEQASAYKKANILALSALAKKGGPNIREMLAVQAKLQEFLTSLIALAGNTSQQLRATVQALVQRLVVSHCYWPVYSMNTMSHQGSEYCWTQYRQ